MKHYKNTNSLIIRGIKQHNLNSIDVTIPHNSFTVVSGVSGSGKSSLVFDTIFAEGQRRYVESLSAYARQFLGKMPKPELDFIEGLAPAIAIEQKVISRNPRSTVATVTEIYDYLKLLFARTGVIYSPISNTPVKKDSVDDVWQFIQNKSPKASSLLVLCKPKSWINASIDEVQELKILLTKGFVRLWIPEHGLIRIDKNKPEIIDFSNSYIVVDRIALSEELEQETISRAKDSIENAFWEGNGTCQIYFEEDKNLVLFSDKLEKDGITFLEPNTNNLSFNSPVGACYKCQGLGEVNDLDIDLIIPDPSLSVYDDAVAPWRGETMKEWKHDFLKQAVLDDFPVHRAYTDLSIKEKNYLWENNKSISLRSFFDFLEEKIYKIQYRVMLSRYKGRTTCTECKGTKLRHDASYVKLELMEPYLNYGQTICLHEILLMSIEEANNFFKSCKLKGENNNAAQRILIEIKNRVSFLVNVGLGYLTLHRLSNTLSGGESQRIRLATSLGSSLSGSMYILDEPSIGLHPRDTGQLIEVLKKLQADGNTVIVVEHEEDMIRQADVLIDIGPGAGINGGNVVFSDNFNLLHTATDSLTADYLLGKKNINTPITRRIPKHFITIKGAKENNLKNIDVSFPLETFCAITGVSGSGKTTLVKKILYPALLKSLGEFSGVKTGKYDSLEGKTKLVSKIELIDQNPLGRSSRSNPVTYVKAWDSIRELMASQGISKSRKYKPSHFSFNVEGGRCEACKGEGETSIEMQFMADIILPCEECNGQRFKDEILEVEISGKNVSEILNMTVDEALDFFNPYKNIVEKLLPLQKVGLGYVKLGQSSSTLSGGEAQRVKLASYLIKGVTQESILFIFDEPTTGLHFDDIVKLLESLQALIEKGHSVIVIEHNMDMIKNADYVIDLGPEGGDKGGYLVYSGTPEGLAEIENSYTGNYLKDKLKKSI